jgi:hypothetical protein
MTPDDVPEALLVEAKYLHVSGISQAISASAIDTVFHAIGVARAAGVRVSYDPNLRLRLWPLDRARAIITATIAMADIFLPSIDDVRQIAGVDTPEAIIDWCHRAGADTVVMKQGSAGAYVSIAGTRTKIAAFKVDAVDATGAGDCFDGSLLARLAAGDDLLTAARYAGAAAALTTTGYGAVAPLRRRCRCGASCPSRCPAGNECARGDDHGSGDPGDRHRRCRGGGAARARAGGRRRARARSDAPHARGSRLGARDCRETFPTRSSAWGRSPIPPSLRKRARPARVFGVSPGLTPELAAAAKASGLPWLPGVMTPSEVMAARAAGFSALKFFPAQPAGGIAMLKALAGPFPDVMFCPTGSITAITASEYLALANVACVGRLVAVHPRSGARGNVDADHRACARGVAPARGKIA